MAALFRVMKYSNKSELCLFQIYKNYIFYAFPFNSVICTNKRSENQLKLNCIFIWLFFSAQNKLISEIQSKQSPVEDLLRQADSLIVNQQPKAEVSNQKSGTDNIKTYSWSYGIIQFNKIFKILFRGPSKDLRILIFTYLIF